MHKSAAVIMQGSYFNLLPLLSSLPAAATRRIRPIGGIVPLPYDEQERRLREAVQAYLADGRQLDILPYAHAGGWIASGLAEYLPDGTYGAEGHLLFAIKDGKIHGEYRDWYRSGQQYEHSQFQEGELHGECRLWDGDGRLWEHRLYQHGQIIKDYLRP